MIVKTYQISRAYSKNFFTLFVEYSARYLNTAVKNRQINILSSLKKL